MNITFKLFATLTDYLPPESRRSNIVELEVDENATVQEVIDPYGIPPRLVHLALVNGVYVAPEDRATRTLNPGDVLAVWPPIAGG